MAPNFAPGSIADALDTCERLWFRRPGEIPAPWMRAYLKPIRIALADFAAVTAKPLLDAWGVLAAEELRLGILARHEVEAPNLPWVRLLPVDGGVNKLRANRADLILIRCNGCGHLHPSHWLETASDEARARNLERRHPAVLAITRGVAVTRFSTYEGCYCGYETGGIETELSFDESSNYDRRLRLDQLAYAEWNELDLAREIAGRAFAIRERCVEANGKEEGHGRRLSA